MTVAKGWQTYLGIGEEVVWGSAVARSKYLEINSEAIEVTEERLVSPSLYRAGTHVDRTGQGSIGAGGAIAFNPHYEGAEKLWRAALGGAPITTQPDVTANPSIRQHIFPVADDLTSYPLTLEVKRGADHFLVIGARIGSMSWRIEAGQLVACTFDIVGKDVDPDTGTSPAFTTTPLVRASEAVLSWGGTTTDVESAEVTVNNALGADRRFIGSRYISEPVREGKIAVAGTFSVEFADTTIWDQFRAASSHALQIVCTGPQIGSTGHYYKFQVDVPVCKIDNFNPTVDNNGRVVAECQFTGFRDDTTTYGEMYLTAKNTLAAV